MRLPDLRNLGVCLRILVLVNLMALIAAILHANSLGEAIRALAEISITLQPTLLLSLLLLYAINPVLQKLSYVWGAAIVIASELFSKYNSLDKLANANYSDVLHVFSGLNYNRTKAKNVIACAKMLIDSFNGKIPRDLDKLILLPGVGRKTANVFLSEHGYPAIGVDTHLAYISQKLSWTKNKDSHKIEMDLKKLFAKNVWSSVNPTVVRFGKKYTSRKKKNIILKEINKIN